LIVFLFLLGFQPAVSLVRRYRNNWKAHSPPFTAVEATALFSIGALGAALATGSIPHSVSKFSCDTLRALLFWSASAVFFLAAAFVRSFWTPKPISEKGNKDDLMDVPITDDAEDRLGRVKFVNDFYAQIKAYPSEDSFVFGLNAPWGSGKTSVLNLLRNRLRKDETVILLDFNPWYFDSAEVMLRQFYDGVARAINQVFFYPQLNSAARRYARVLAPLLKRYGVEFIQWDEPTVAELRQRVESYILKSGRRVVVMIDDLERAHRDELHTILQTVRLGASFKNTLFVLAYDQAQISRQLRRAGVSSEFLAKIIQSPEDLPPADRSDIDRFLINSESADNKCQLDKLLDKLGVSGDRRNRFDSAIIEFYPSNLSPFFPTLRNAKRFLLKLSVRLPAVIDEVNLFDFLLLEILRVFANPVYQDIWNNRYYYLPAWSTKDVMSSPFGYEFDEKQKEERRQKTRTHLDKLLIGVTERERVLQILRKLFPLRIKDAFNEATGPTEAPAMLRANQRLTHPESFDKYFLLAVPEGTISDAAVESIIEAWHRASEPEDQILESLAKLSETHELVEVLERIVVFLGQIEESLVKPLLRGLSLNLKSVPFDGDRSEQNAQMTLIISILNVKVARADEQATVETILEDIKSIDVAVRFMDALTNDRVVPTWGLRQVLDIVRIRELIRERFEREFLETEADIFEINSLPLSVLYQIGAYDADSKGTINAYAMALFERKPAYIGKVIDSFLIEYPGAPQSFQFEQLKSVYDVQRLAEIVKRAGEHAWNNDREKRAIDMFLSRLEDPGTSPP
jgi:ABC-type branched-subunit amino acid transport system ATPase component